MSRVFVNYRRADAAAHANLLYDWIRERYGEDRVFKDVDSIEPGMDFEEAIERAVASSAVMLVVIGNEWLVESSGRRRLEEPYDYVRLEVGAALERNIRVIPVLVEAHGLAKRFGDRRVFAGVDVDVPRGGFLLVTGPNGSGKTTLLRILRQLAAPSAGELDLPPRGTVRVPGHGPVGSRAPPPARSRTPA